MCFSDVIAACLHAYYYDCPGGCYASFEEETARSALSFSMKTELFISINLYLLGSPLVDAVTTLATLPGVHTLI